MKTRIPQVTEDLLQEIVHRIVEVANPEKIVLFGSRGRGGGHARSDLDILVIKQSDEPRFRRPVILYGALSDIMIPMDILVYTPEEVSEWSNVRQAFPTTAIREGRVLYEKEG